MIVSASRRTDIPAFYFDWFCNRLRDGFVDVVNPLCHGACIDGRLIECITGKPVKAGKAKSQRPLCNCVESFDIGQYDTCIHGCRYCYANASLG